VRDAGIVTTPALQLAVRDRGFDAGAVITASHNPPEFNGIKFIAPDGTEMASGTEDAIERIYFGENFRLVEWSEIGSVQPGLGVNDAYVDAIAKLVDVETIRRAKLRVVLDTSNGAGGLTAPFLLRKLGCQVITLNAQPDGNFPGHPSEPTPDNVRDLVRATTAFAAHVGVVQDGDADRCVFVDEQGNYVWGDRTLALMAGRAVRAHPGGVVVTPVSSSLAVADVVKAAGGRLEETRVGAPVVARRMRETKAVFGGEENGGLIWPEHQFCRDASMTLARLLELLATTGQPLSKLLAEVPTYGQFKTKAKCPDGKKQGALTALAGRHRGERVDTTDGVKIFRDGGWVLVRPSGTEPIFRVYAEGKTEEDAKRLATDALREIETIIGSI
jgi:phosphomannomutase/phosphoglucomutase